MKSPDGSRRPIHVRKLAEDVAASIADLLRLRSIGRESARMYRDSRLMRWMAREARSVVRDGLENDPWSGAEVDALAQRIRAAAAAEKAGVRQLSGRPGCVTAPVLSRVPGEAGLPDSAGPVPWVQLATAAGIGREIWDEDCDTWIAVPDDLPLGRYVALNVSGESMSPLLHDGDVVLVNMAASPRPGDIVLARTDEGYVVKRLARISTAGVLLESLNSEFGPITIRDLPRPIAGVVVLRWCEHTQRPADLT